MWTILESLLNLLRYCFCVLFWYSGPEVWDLNQYPLHWKVKSATGPPGQLQGIWFSDEDWNPPWRTQAQWGWDGESKGLVRLGCWSA